MNMKTRRYCLHLIIYTASLLFAASCENEIPYTPANSEPQLIMNALLDAGEAENYVFLNVSGVEGLSHVENADVTLYVNGQSVETLEEMPPLKPIGSLDMVYDPNAPLNNLPEIAKRKKYRMTTSLKPGDDIRLEATAENGKYHVWAEVTVPYPVDEIRVDTCIVPLKEYGGWSNYRRFKVTLKDRPGERNYYRLDIRHDITSYGQYESIKDTIIHSRETYLVNREDVVLTDGNPSYNEDGEDDFFGTYIENLYNVFTDGRFANSDCTLKVYSKPYDNYSPAYLYHISRNVRTITIRLLSITEAEFRYLKALNYLASDNYEDAIMEPVMIPSNVNGGLGFVGISSETRVIMQLPDEIFDNDLPFTE